MADKPDSHDICFIPSGDTRGYLAERVAAAPGELVDATTGTVLGRHDGVAGFTVGQRRGLGLDRPAADGRPRYVLGIEPTTATVRVGPVEALDVHALTATDPVWTDGPCAGDAVVQVRAHGGTAPASLSVADGTVTASLRTPLQGVAPGQAAVFYRPDPGGDVVLGSATISGTVLDED